MINEPAPGKPLYPFEISWDVVRSERCHAKRKQAAWDVHVSHTHSGPRATERQYSVCVRAHVCKHLVHNYLQQKFGT